VCYAPGSFLQANTEAYNALLSAVRRHVPAGSAVSELYAGAGAIGLSLAASETSGDSFSLRCVEIVEAARETFDLSARETLGTGPEGDARLANVAFRVAAAADAAAEAVRGADAVVVDPPRKGLDARTLAALAGHDPAFTNVHERSGKPLEASADPRHGKQGAAGSGRKKRNKRNRRAKKKRDVNGVVDPSSLSTTPPPPDRLRTLIYVSCGFASFERDCDALVRSGQWALRHAEGFNFFPGSDALETLAVFERVGGGDDENERDVRRYDQPISRT
jgi:tRNA/tmRNA/rRNA uracil-C5-methylase (TrmA/RlmC/RlmD family)